MFSKMFQNEENAALTLSGLPHGPLTNRAKTASNLPNQIIHDSPNNYGSLSQPSVDNVFSTSLPVVLDGEHTVLEASQLCGDFREDAFEHLDEDVVARTIGHILPNDEELFHGLADSFGIVNLRAEESDDFDLFSSGGVFELDTDNQESYRAHAKSSRGLDYVYESATGFRGLQVGPLLVSGEHPFGEHPSRTLFVRNINSNVEDSELRELFEEYGDIRSLYTACKHRGFVMISYYDIRSARSAMRALQNKPLRRRKLDIHFSIPKDNPSDKDKNQGTLVVFNLDASVSNDDLYQIFGQYGQVKEIRETPHKHNHKFIEFYDVRAAEAALRALNRSDIAGKRVKLEPSRPGGARRSLTQQLSQDHEEESRLYRQQSSPSWAKSPSGHFSAWAHLGSPMEGGLQKSWQLGPLKSSPIFSHSNSVQMGTRGMHAEHGQFGGMPPLHNAGVGFSLRHAHSMPDYNNGMTLPSMSPMPTRATTMYMGHDNIGGSRLSGFARIFDRAPGAVGTSNNGGSLNHFDSGSPLLSGPQFLWGDSSLHNQTSSPVTWSSSPVTHSFSLQGHVQLQHLGSQGHVINGTLPSQTSHFRSAPSGNLSFLERYHGATREVDASFFNMGLLGVAGMNASNMVNIGVDAGYDNALSTSLELMTPHMRGRMSGISLGRMLDECMRMHRPVSSASQADNQKQYQLDIEAIRRGEDNRTTLMIRNIPNKYTCKMLLAAIDEKHQGLYDFMYLPIDFKNKCNMGYVFINMTSPAHIISIYETFNGKKWEKFNSEKVASLSYARIQGKAALVAHFQNSSLMNEDKRCRPIVFHSEVGDQLGMGDFVEMASLPNARDALLQVGSSNLNSGMPEED